MFSIGHSAKILSRAETDARRKKSNVTERRRLRRVCQVSNLRHSASYASLPSVKVRALGKASSFAECQSSGTRQSFFLCRVSCFRNSAKLLPLSCVKVQALGKASSFAVCHVPCTRQSFCLCRVSKFRHSANTSQNAQNFGFFAECHSADTR